MSVLGGGSGNLWAWQNHFRQFKSKRSENRRNRPKSNSSNFPQSTGQSYFRFPLQQALTSGSLALAGDTIAQIRERWSNRDTLEQSSRSNSDVLNKDESWSLAEHDWLRALRMTSYGIFLYGPGSYIWYQYLDRALPQQTAKNLMLKVLLNQVVLGPCVIAVIFAWNYLWQGKLEQLPDKYREDALPALLYGFRFWIPVSALNFWVVPLQARVAFMSTGSIFWNFYLSSTMSK